MSKPSTINRRDFLKISGTAGAGLLISVYLSGCDSSTPTPAESTAAPSATLLPTDPADPTATLEPTLAFDPNASVEPNVFVRISGDDTVTITIPRPELGQGVRTSLGMIIAEGLNADWSRVRVEQAVADRSYGEQNVGGSKSILESYAKLRKAGATARALLINAAAEIWEVDRSSCYAERGEVVHQPTGRRLSYGALAEVAATLSRPKNNQIELKDPSDFTIIGNRFGQIDNPLYASGSAVFGMDVRLPGMLYATLARTPVVGGRLTGFNATQAKAVEGVRHVVQINDGVAVVADNTWAALKGRDALETSWSEPSPALSSDEVRGWLREGVLEGKDPDDNTTLSAVYEMPFYAHATMEPMNCVADVRSDRCEIWAPTQSPENARQNAATRTGMPQDNVTVHVPLVGGGFGRRISVDYVTQAVEISKEVEAPVLLFWTREDDIRYDRFHPMSTHLMSGKTDRAKQPRRNSSESDALPTGAWRAVNNFTNAFVRECFIDELAAAKGVDPLEHRLELQKDDALAETLELAASKAGWGTSLPDGWGRGLACHALWGRTPVAQIAEVSVTEGGVVRVHRVVCAVNCGLVINPDMVEAQMEGGIVWGMTAALKKGITFKDGRIQQSNFHDYPILRIDEMPLIEVYIVPSSASPEGIGEAGVCPAAPAVLNAVYAATGVRIWRIPIQPEDFSTG
jgi:isoquinoline 1-oxidoreductase beta subunit